MNILLASGFGMTVQPIGDPARDAYWLIGDELENQGHTVFRREWDAITPTTILSVNAAIVYSYGCAGFFRALSILGTTPPLQKLMIVAGVPNVPDYGQGGVYAQGGWIAPPMIDQAICCQVDSIPASCAIKDAPWITLTDPPSAVPTFAEKRLNINCNAVVGSLAPWDRHIRIKDSRTVAAIASKMMG